MFNYDHFELSPEEAQYVLNVHGVVGHRAGEADAKLELPVIEEDGRLRLNETELDGIGRCIELNEEISIRLRDQVSSEMKKLPNPRIGAAAVQQQRMESFIESSLLKSRYGAIILKEAGMLKDGLVTNQLLPQRSA